MEIRVGLGYDSHRFEKGRKLYIGGVEIQCDYGLKSHSDGDILIHALLMQFLVQSPTKISDKFSQIQIKNLKV